MEVRRSTFHEITAEPAFDALMAEYAAECAISGLPTPHYDRGMYKLFEDQQMMISLAAYTEGELIGFAAVLVVMNPHYSHKIANTESFFVGKAHRATGAGLVLKRRIEQEAKEAGAVGLFICTPIGGKLAAVMATDRKYKETTRVFFQSFPK